MKLIVTRSQHWGGFWNNVRFFCLDILGAFTDAEVAAINRYELRGRHLYTSPQWLAKHDAILPVGRVLLGHWTADELINSAVSSLTLDKAYHITVGDLVDGTHVQSASLEELNLVYGVVVDGAKALDAYLRHAVTFESCDGSANEELVDLTGSAR
jgi:hypothetical protein